MSNAYQKTIECSGIRTALYFGKAIRSIKKIRQRKEIVNKEIYSKMNEKLASRI